MAHIPVDQLTKQQHDELCVTYAALLLHDGGAEITAEKLIRVIQSSGNQVESYWPSMFAKMLQGRNIDDLIIGGGAAPVASATPSVGGNVVEAAKEEEPEAEEEEEDLGFSLFD